MKLATLVYVRQGGRTLMVHRTKKPNDMHAGKWNGLGGKLEPGETPEACAVREVREESGLTITAPALRGLLTFPLFSQGEDWLAFVFVARRFEGALIDSPEGRLAWIDDALLLDLPLWPGDRIFLPWLDRPELFSARFDYHDGVLQRWQATFYGPGGAVARTEQAEVVVTAPPTPAASDAAYRYTPAEDTYCWVCGGPVLKRHCKITCLACGFTRDCSDP
jgi:8-oxo-dGTP diphosphatase